MKEMYDGLKMMDRKEYIKYFGRKSTIILF